LRFTGHITAIGRHRYPEHGRIIPPDDRFFIPLEEVSLARALKPAGYTSASIGKWHVGNEPKYWPLGHGFDVNVAGHSYGSPPSYWYPYKAPDRDWNNEIPTLKGGTKGEYLTNRLTDESIDFMKDNKDRPFFLYLPHYAVHTPLQAPPDLVEKYRGKMQADRSQKSPIYGAMIENLDWNVGRLTSTLQELGLEEDTVFIFASDNGGELEATRNAPLREGKGYLYEGGIRVPLIVKWPGRAPEGSTCHAPVTSEDLYPTIVEMAGEGTASNEVLDGRSLVPLLEGSGGIGNRDLHWYYPHYSPQARMPGAVIRSGDYKLIQHYDPDKVELYDLSQDLGEKKDLSGKDPGMTAKLQEALDDWLRSVDAQMHTLNPDYLPERPA
jgi:arylsulfatase A-like enzyme